MRTPFTDYLLAETAGRTTLITPKLDSPLLDPEHIDEGKETFEGFPSSFEEVDDEVRSAPLIDLEKAVRVNKKYERDLWGSHFQLIVRYLTSAGFAKKDLTSNNADFANAIARWQQTVFKNRNEIDGILGPRSWNLLRPLLTATRVVPSPSVPVQQRSRWHQYIKNTVLCPAVPLVHGEETFKQMVKAIRTANSSSHYIYILGWMLDIEFEMIPGNPSTTLLKLLTEANNKGVQIRLMIWDNPMYQTEINNAEKKINALPRSILVKDNATYGSQGLKDAISTARSITKALSFTHPILRAIPQWNSLRDQLDIVQNEGSHHEKVVVVKGSEGLIGFCGGIDINPNRITGVELFESGLARSTTLHDIHCEVRGHAAWVLAHRFIWRWQVYFAERGAQAMPALLGAGDPVPPAAAPSAGVAHVKILQTYNHPSQRIQDRSIRETVKFAIEKAQTSIHLEDQYMISLEIANWLNKKLQEPQFTSLSILTQDDPLAGELFFPKAMRRKFMDQLYAGLSAAEKKKVSLQMLDPFVPPLAHHRVHSKLYIIDDELAIIGSANCSSRSMTHDSETAAVIFNDPDSNESFVARLKKAIKAYPQQATIIPYEPNKDFKDKDEAIADALDSNWLLLAGPMVKLTIPTIINTIVTKLKPAIIDIVDPDADDTQPQQELFDVANEQYSHMQADDRDENSLPTPFVDLTADDEQEAYTEEAGKSAEWEEDLQENAADFSYEQILSALSIKGYEDVGNSGLPLLRADASTRNQPLSRNFSVGEFAQAANGKYKWEYYRLDTDLINELQKLREKIQKPIKIIDGYYPPKYFSDILKKPVRDNNPHFSGRGIKIRVPGMSSVELAKKAIEFCDETTNIAVGDTTISLYVKQSLPRLSYYIKNEGKRKQAIQILQRTLDIFNPKETVVKVLNFDYVLPKSFIRSFSPENDLRVKKEVLRTAKENIAALQFSLGKLKASSRDDVREILKTAKGFTKLGSDLDKMSEKDFLKSLPANMPEEEKNLLIETRKKEMGRLAQLIKADSSKMSYIGKIEFLSNSISLLQDLDKINSIEERKKAYDEFFHNNSLATVYYGTDLLEAITKTTFDTIRLGVSIGLVLSSNVETQANLLKISEGLSKVAKGIVVVVEGLNIAKEITSVIYSLVTGQKIDWESTLERLGKSITTIYLTLTVGTSLLGLASAGYLYLKLIGYVLKLGAEVKYNTAVGGTIWAIKEMNEKFNIVTENYVYAKYDFERIGKKIGYSDYGLTSHPDYSKKLKEDYYALHRKLDDFRQYVLSFCQPALFTNYYTTFPSIPNRIYSGSVYFKEKFHRIQERLKSPEDFTFDYIDALNEYYNIFYEGIIKCHLEIKEIVEERLTKRAEHCVSASSFLFDTKKSTIDETMDRQLNDASSVETRFYDSVENDELEAYEKTDENDEAEVLPEVGIPGELEIAELMEYQAAVVQSSVKACEGRTCWAKEVLNRLLNTSLIPNNSLDEATKKALASFQTENNLPVTQRIDAATERALLEADALHRTKGTALEAAANAVIITARTKLEDWTKKAVKNKPQYILDIYRDPRKVHAFVLHHMAFKRRSRKTNKFSDPESYVSTGAHFCILLDGRVIQLHPFSRMIWHGHCISPRSVAVEFEGNFPNIKGKWWIDRKSSVQNKDVPTKEQYEAGRFLACYLKTVLGTSTILAHRQSSKDRENDPGPDIWFNVGQWAVEKLGMSDGGPLFKCGDGNPILPEWRTWGNKTSTLIQEYNEEQEWQQDYVDDETDRYGAETEEENFYTEEMEAESLYNEMEDLAKDWAKVVQMNRQYSEQLGWNQYHDKINDLLLPFSGLSNVSLSEEAFARAVAEWQRQQGFAVKDCDGIIGPNTWRFMKPLVVTNVSSPSVIVTGSATSIESPPAVYSTEKVPQGFRQGSYKEWRGLDKKSVMRVDEAAKLINRKIDLKSRGIIEVDIDTFQRIANAETGGKIQNFYSYDRAIVSMGFRQFTFIHNNIHEWIKKAPAAFKRYGIEIDDVLPPYIIRQGKYIYKVARIKGVDNPETLRWNGWAQRFYYAGLDYDVIVAEFLLAKEFFANELQRLKAKLNAPQQFVKFLKFYNQLGHLRAFFHELNNALPAYVPAIVTQALNRTGENEIGTQFLQTFFETAKQKWPDPDQAVRIFDKTMMGSKITVFEGESVDGAHEAEWSEEAIDDSVVEHVEEADEETPGFENYSTATNLSKLADWAYLLKFKVPDAIADQLKARNMAVQYAHNESYSNDLNIDFYRLRIERYPTLGGVKMNAQSLIKYIRLNINKLVDTSYCDWNPYNMYIDLPLWLSDNPTGTVLRQDIKGPDNAAVVVSFAQPNGWRFSTVTTPDTGRHPVSGHREFFISKDPATGGTYFLIKGLDMLSTGVAGMGFPFFGKWGYKQGDLLWKSMREKVIAFINANGGVARQEMTYSERIEWRFVYYRYKNLLESVFGKGAGSAENSPFLTFETEEQIAE